MADAWQTAWVEVVPDFREFREKANNTMVPILGDAGGKGGTAGSAAFGSTLLAGISRLALPVAGVIAGLGIGDAIGRAVQAGIDFLGESVVAAMDLNESVNALNVAFGEAGAGINSLGQEAAQALGISNLEFNNFAVRFSGFADTIVGAGGDVVGFIEQLTTRGADFASVYNIEVAEALQLFQSGLAGETEPLRRFGVDLSAAAVEAYAYAAGIAVVGEELTEAQKQQGRYGLLLQETAVVEGDRANTADQLAGSLRTLSATFEDAKARLGVSLLPGLTELANFANEKLIPIFNDFIDKVGPELGDALIESAPALASIALSLAQILPPLTKIGSESLPPVVVGIGALSAGLAVATPGILAFIGVLNTVPDAVGSAAAAFNAMTAPVQSAIGQVLAAVRTLPSSIIIALANARDWLVQTGRDLIDGFINGIRGRVGSLIDSVLGPVRSIIEQVKRVLGIASPSRVFAEIGAFSADGFFTGWESRIRTSTLNIPGVNLPRPAAGAVGRATASDGGRVGFANYGTIQVTDEAALASEVEKRQRRANSLAQIGRVAVG